MQEGWLLYDKCDFEQNRMFASHIRETGERRNLAFDVVFTEDLSDSLSSLPDFVISRQRNPKLSAQIEQLGIPVFNSSRVCDLCNDKRNTHRFLEGLPLMRSAFLEPYEAYTPAADAFPLVVKPAFGHGGDRVVQVNDQQELDCALAAVYPLQAIAQELASEAGRDLRVYVLFGEIKAAVLRTARSGIVSNFKRGGNVALHTVTAAERELAQAVIERFSAEGAPLSFAGVDLIYHRGEPVVNEVEDVVGSRMLYQVGGPDILAHYVNGIAERLSQGRCQRL